MKYLLFTLVMTPLVYAKVKTPFTVNHLSDNFFSPSTIQFLQNIPIENQKEAVEITKTCSLIQIKKDSDETSQFEKNLEYRITNIETTDNYLLISGNSFRNDPSEFKLKCLKQNKDSAFDPETVSIGDLLYHYLKRQIILIP